MLKYYEASIFLNKLNELLVKRTDENLEEAFEKLKKWYIDLRGSIENL